MEIAPTQLISINSSHTDPDSAQEHASYDTWFRTRVEAARVEAADSAQQKYTPEEWRSVSMAALKKKKCRASIRLTSNHE
jgi:hypothetical protein